MTNSLTPPWAKQPRIHPTIHQRVLQSYAQRLANAQAYQIAQQAANYAAQNPSSQMVGVAIPSPITPLSNSTMIPQVPNSYVRFNVITSPNSTSTPTTASIVATSGSTLAVYNSTTGTGTIIQNVANGLYSVQDEDDYFNSPLVRDCLKLMGECSVADGESARITMPDGSIVDVKSDGSYTIHDKDAKLVYRANRIRNFNPFINVSDRLEEFIDFCGKHGVRKDEMLQLPINLFIGWLVVQAAKADKEPEPDIKLIPDLRKKVSPHCPSCGKFVSPKRVLKQVMFCAPVCFEKHYQRVVV